MHAAPLYRVCSLFRINYANVSLTPRLVASLIAPDSIEFYTIVVGSSRFKKKKKKKQRERELNSCDKMEIHVDGFTWINNEESHVGEDDIIN